MTDHEELLAWMNRHSDFGIARDAAAIRSLQAQLAQMTTNYQVTSQQREQQATIIRAAEVQLEANQHDIDNLVDGLSSERKARLESECNIKLAHAWQAQWQTRAEAAERRLAEVENKLKSADPTPRVDTQLVHDTFGVDTVTANFARVLEHEITDKDRTIRSYQDLLALAERRWQRDIIIVEAETVERCAKVAEDYLKGGVPASTMALYLPRSIRALAPAAEREGTEKKEQT